jgi:hypothetical protein
MRNLFDLELALLTGPIFGSDNEGAASGEKPEVKADATGAAGTANPPEETTDGEKPININPDDHAKAIRDRDTAKGELAALQQEKAEREEADAAAVAATRSKEENQEAQIKELTESNESYQRVNESNLVKIAILEESKYTWHDTDLISKMIDKSALKIDAKKGTVEGVTDELKRIAKESPFLLKGTKKDQQENSGGESGAGLPGQPSGGTPGGSRDANAQANKRAAMVARFGPVLTP